MSRQLELFEHQGAVAASRDYLGVSGLVYVQNVLSSSEQKRALDAIDERPWQNDLKRRVQHYGYKYDYKARKIDSSMFVGPLPDFAIEVAERLVQLGILAEQPDQLIVNEYEPGQGITAHIDCEPCFKDTIVTVSLGSVYEMDLIHAETDEIRSLNLQLGSALILSGDARYMWKHRIMARKTDHGRPRGRRVSLTFRNVILAAS